MASAYFDFKRFRIYHDKCAMKVGTDGVLLGAWCTLPQHHRVLDVGCGCGLIGMMVAQRYPDAHVTGIDIDENAVAQAQENAKNSPYDRKLCFKCADVRDYVTEAFDAIVCNPPFYTADTLPPDARRASARNSAGLPLDVLIRNVYRLLGDGGTFHVVLPTAVADEFGVTCALHGMPMTHRCMVKTVARKAPKRALMSFVKGEYPGAAIAQEIILQEGSERSAQYQELTRDFYL